MSDPRADVKYDAIRAEYTTYKIDDSTITYEATEANGSSVAGRAVTLSAAETVALAADGEPIEGKLISVEADGYCTVQTGGFMTLPAGTGASLTLGKKIVGDLLSAAKGYIREVDTTTAAELGLARGRVIDAGVTTAVVVEL